MAICPGAVRFRWPIPFSLGFVCFWLIAFWVVATAASAGQATVSTYHNDKGRTGHNLLETTLTLSNVNSTQFGRIFSQYVDGYIYAQPLYVPNVSVAGLGTHNAVFVATMNDSVYAFDADNRAGSNAQPLWKVSFIDPKKGITTVSSNDVNCSDLITPEIGVVGTPVIDTTSGTLYVVARTKEKKGVFYQRLHALDIGSGAEKFGGPVVIQASVAGTGNGSVNGTLSFNPQIQNQRSALLLQNGQVYIAWGSHCDSGGYHGWLMAYDDKSLEQKGAWATTPNGEQGAIWESGSGPAGDESLNTYFATGNGTFDANSAGTDYGQSMVKLASPKKGTFAVLDYFTPYNGPNLNVGDFDIGSGGLMLLPDQTSGPVLHLLIQGDKVGNIYLVNRDNMGHYNAQNNNQIVQYLAGAELGMWNSPTFWNNRIYFGAANDTLKEFGFNPSNGLLNTAPASQTTAPFPYPGTTISVSANQDSNAIAWGLDNSSYKTNTGAVLHAYDAKNLATELYNTNQNASRDNPGGAVKFAVPTVVNGKVYVGTQSKLSVYGLISSSSQGKESSVRSSDGSSRLK
ncbi:MAG TPA: pyrrolo-quinoline quinone [Candidatus Sulfotelmatobacter sp.]|jgi:hypothetical protein